MGVKITIPKGAEIKVEHFKFKDGREGTKTIFPCNLEDGTLYGNCQAFGDRSTQLKEAMTEGKPLEVDGIGEDKGQFGRQIQFPKGSGGEAGWRGGAGKGNWTPQYRGKAMSYDRWWEITEDGFERAVKLIKKGTKAAGLDVEPAVMAEQARSLVAQFWMETEKSLTFVPGCEPAAESAQTGSATAPTDTKTDKPSIENVIASLKKRIETVTLDQCEALSDEITAAEGIPADERGSLHAILFAKKKALKAG